MTDMPSGEISLEPSGHAVPGESRYLTPLVVFRRDSEPESDNIDPFHQTIQDLPVLHDPASSTENLPSAQQYESSAAFMTLDWPSAQEFENYDDIWAKDMIQEPGCSASNAQNLTSLSGLHDPALSANDMIQDPGCSASNVSFGSRENNKVTSYLNVVPQMNNNIADAEEKHNRVKQGKKPKMDSLTMDAVEKHFEKTLDEASKSLDVSRSTLKRFCREHGISSWPLSKHNGDDPAVSKSTVKPNYTNIPDIKMVIVKATYGEDMIKFQFLTSSGLLELEQEVARRIKLNVARLRLKYKDEDEDMILLACDDDLSFLLRLTTMHSTIKLIAEGR